MLSNRFHQTISAWVHHLTTDVHLTWTLQHHQPIIFLLLLFSFNNFGWRFNLWAPIYMSWWMLCNDFCETVLMFIALCTFALNPRRSYIHIALKCEDCHTDCLIITGGLEISHNCGLSSAEVSAWINNYIAWLHVVVITNPCLNYKGSL